MCVDLPPPPSRARSMPPIVTDSTLEHIDIDASFQIGSNDHSGEGFKTDEIAQYRASAWPDVSNRVPINETLDIYKEVKTTGVPNMCGARRRVPSLLNHSVWEAISTGHDDDALVLDGVKYGFPLQYEGPTLQRPNKATHQSADQFMPHVRQYVQIETANRAMIGPFTHSPFDPWINISPLMTRPKSGSSKRRIIVDLTYPHGDNVNSFIKKNTIFGVYHEHSLPTVQDTVRVIQERQFRVMLATLDIERAYRNIPVCPLDLPLLGISVDGLLYVDTAMPFGARNSSLYMQKIANYVVRALAARGIQCHIYLDDMVMELDSDQDCHARFAEVLALYRALGLPIAYSKIQPPDTQVIYLGIHVDVGARLLSIPKEKIDSFLQLIRWALGQVSITKKMVQRIVGKINHIGRCVHGARLFMSRILQALREAHDRDNINIADIRPDLHWFAMFLAKFNGVSAIKQRLPSKIIMADSCLTGGGATDMTRCYSVTYTPAVAAAHHINSLEALNCLVALKTLISSKDRSTVIELQCDNSATVYALAYGRARDPTLSAICRAVWYFTARLDVELLVTHVPGKYMDIADALSRAHLSDDEHARAQRFITQYSLQCVTPQKHAMNYKPFF